MIKNSLLLIVLLACCSLVAASQEICDNGIDDDSDGLVDFQDPDCRASVYPLIKNPSFEKIYQCPSSYSQLQYATDWLQPSSGAAGSTDLYHKCGGCAYKYNTLVSNMPLPPPDGSGFAGFFDIRDWYKQGSYKEYATTCLDEGLERNTTYVLEFYLGFLRPMVLQPPSNSYYSYSPINISLFGHPTCSALPYGQVNDSVWRKCPVSTSPQWVELTRLTVSGSAGSWVKARAEFAAPVNVKALVIGPSCEAAPQGGDNDWGFYLLDQVLLYRKAEYDLPEINRTGDICADTLTLTPLINLRTAADGYQWYKDGAALVGETAPALKLTRKRYGAGYYAVKVSVNGKTYLSPEATVGVNDADFTLEDTVMFCKNTPIQLTPQLAPTTSDCPVTYRWQDGSVTPALTVTAPGVYWFETERDGCKHRDSVWVIAQPAPVVNLGADTTLCSNDQLVLSAGSTVNNRYEWQDHSTTSTFTVRAPGTFHVSVSNAYCTAADTITVRYKAPPEISFPNDTILCKDEQKHLVPAVSGDTFAWNTGSTTPDITVSRPGVYQLQAQNQCGSLTKAIRIVSGSCLFFMPSAFTPNNDGLNDTFGTSLQFIRKMKLTVFNRWGQVVYASDTPFGRWDGTISGKPATAGVYVWIVRYTDWRGLEHVEKGTVVLIR